MDPEIITYIWFAIGLLLCAAEFLLPGLVVVFMGLASIAVGILRWVGLVEGLPESFFTWMITSVLMVLVFRKAAMKWFPAESQDDRFNEDADAFGKLVDVIDEIHEGHNRGRIRFQGTSWPATCVNGSIPAGQKARIVYRNNLDWVVEAADAETPHALEAPKAKPVPENVGAVKQEHS
jgi:inner membrane protein